MSNKRSDADEVTYHKKVIKNRAISTVIIAVLLLIINFLAHIHVIDTVEEVAHVEFFECLYNLANTIIGIIFGIGASSLALDFFSYVKYTQERIKEVVIDKRYLNTLSPEEKKRIIASLESSLYFKDIPIPPDSLYVNIKSKIIPLLDKEYLTNYYLHIDCRIENGTIIKDMTHELSIYSSNENADFTLPFCLYMDKVGNHKYEITSLKFNNELIKDFNSDQYLRVDDTTDERNTEMIKNSLIYPFKLAKGINTIMYTSMTHVDISDNTFSHNLTMPCKHYVAEMSIKDDSYIVRGSGFAIDKAKTLNLKYFKNSCRVEFTDWVIPGDGVMFIINKADASTKST